MWASDVSECLLSPGEVLVARSNTPELVGRVAMFTGEPRDAVASDLTIRVLPGGELKSSLLTSYLSFLYLGGYWREKAAGASGTMKKITRSQLIEQQIPVPSVATQERLVERLSERMAVANQACKALEEQLESVNGLPAAILRRAFNGEL